MALDSTEFRICLLGMWGFHGKVIAEQVRKYDGTKFAVSTIYRILRKHKIRLRDYRDGKGDEAATVLKQVHRRADRRGPSGRRARARSA